MWSSTQAGWEIWGQWRNSQCQGATRSLAGGALVPLPPIGPAVLLASGSQLCLVQVQLGTLSLGSASVAFAGFLVSSWQRRLALGAAVRASDGASIRSMSEKSLSCQMAARRRRCPTMELWNARRGAIPPSRGPTGAPPPAGPATDSGAAANCSPPTKIVLASYLAM